jgi:hypothetical protein
MSVRDMKKMLGRLRALGAPMEIQSVVEEEGHAHVIFHNKDTYKGFWRNGKMNGYGTFRKNEVQRNQYEWQFCGQFKDDCATSGQLSTLLDPDGEARREYRALVEKMKRDNQNEAERDHWEQFKHVTSR